MRRHDLMALFRRHSAKSIIVTNQMVKSVFHINHPKKQIIRGTHRVPRRAEKSQRSQMGMAKRTRISQRMSQHIMAIRLVLRITASEISINLIG